MTSWISVNEMQAAEIFSDALGALALQPLEYGVTKSKWMSNGGSAESYQALMYCIRAAKLAAFGTCVFVIPYERYKKIADGYRTFGDGRIHPEPGSAFTLDRYSNRTTFEEDFPTAEVVRWEYRVGHDKSCWFIDCVRNSFAHGHTTLKRDREDRYAMVEMMNAPGGMAPKFQVKMRVEDFDKLVKQALPGFIQTIVEDVAPGKFRLLESANFLMDEIAQDLHPH